MVRNSGTNGYVIADAVRFVVAEGSRYRIFQESFFPLGWADPDAAPSLNPDRDGRSNLQEYGAHTHPLDGSNPWRGTAIYRKDDAIYYAFAYDDDLSDLRTRVELATDLEHWTTVFDSALDRKKAPAQLKAEVALPFSGATFFRHAIDLLAP